MTLGMCICQVGLYFCTNLAVYSHSSCNRLIFACQTRIHATFFSSSIYLLQSCYLLHFLQHLLPLSIPCLTSHQKVLHILHLATVTFGTLLLPLQTSLSPHLHLHLYPLRFVSFLLVFFLLTPTHLALNSPLTSSGIIIIHNNNNNNNNNIWM